MTAILFIIGLISILGQVVLLRELNVASFGVELVYILALGFWLAATALGALSCRSSRAPRPDLLTIPLLLFAALLPLAVAFARGSRVLAGGVPGAYLPFGEQILTIGITLLPAGFLTGWLFRRAAGFFVKEGRTVAAAYAIESAGGIAGGLLSSLGLHWGVQNFALALIGALIAAAAPLLITAGARQSQSRLPAVTLCAILLLCLYQAPALDGVMTRWNHPSLLREPGYALMAGSVSLSARQQVSVFVNNALAFETEGTEAEHFAHLAALQHPRPERILILGGGIEGTVAEVLKHGPVAVDYVEVDPAMIGTVREHLSPQRQEPLGKPGVRIITDDPRRFLQAEGRYDLILIGMPEPSSGQANRFYTLEFFKLCRDRLKPDGIVALKIQAAENRWTPQMTERALSIHGALLSVFGNVLIIPGDTDVVTASSVSLPSDPQVLIERLRSRGIRSRLISEPFIRYLLTNDRFSEVGETVRTRTAPLNTDRRPICYQLTSLLWLSKFYPALTGLSFGEIESLMKEKRTWIAAAAGLAADPLFHCPHETLLARDSPRGGCGVCRHGSRDGADPAIPDPSRRPVPRPGASHHGLHARPDCRLLRRRRGGPRQEPVPHTRPEMGDRLCRRLHAPRDPCLLPGPDRPVYGSRRNGGAARGGGFSRGGRLCLCKLQEGAGSGKGDLAPLCSRSLRRLPRLRCREPLHGAAHRHGHDGSRDGHPVARWPCCSYSRCAAGRRDSD